MSSSTNQTQLALEEEVLDIVLKYMHPPLLALVFEFLFFGVNLVLSIAYIMLHFRQKERRNLFYPLGNLVIFVFATAGLALSVLDVLNEIKLFITVGFTNLSPVSPEELLVDYRSAIGTLYTVGNVIADFVLIYRCYIVWGSKKRIIALPTFIAIANCGISLAAIGAIKSGSNHLYTTGHDDKVSAGDKLVYVFLGINVFENTLLTCLIAFRIWWISRSATKIFGSETSDKRYSSIIAMFLESGLIYPVALIICLVVQATGSVATMDPVLLQIVGIAPNLILLRTVLGVAVENDHPQESERDLETHAEETKHLGTNSTAKNGGYYTSGTPFAGTTTLASTSDCNAPAGSTSKSLYGHNKGPEHSRMMSDGSVAEEFNPYQARSESRPMLSEKEREIRLEPMRNSFTQ